jgi:hypothetical protein
MGNAVYHLYEYSDSHFFPLSPYIPFHPLIFSLSRTTHFFSFFFLSLVMFWAYPLLVLFSAKLALSSAVTPANVFTGCQTALPGSQTNITSSAITTSTQCNTACSKITPAVSHSNWQAGTMNCLCSSKYSGPPSNDYGNADGCNSPNDWDSRLTTTSYHLVGCYGVPPAGLTSNGKTGPNGCLSSCTQQTQAGFFIGSVSSSCHRG